MIDDTRYLELVGEVIRIDLKTDWLLECLDLPGVDWIAEDDVVINNLLIGDEEHVGFELAEDNGFILDKDNEEHQRLVVDALYDSYEVGTTKAWSQRVKNIINNFFIDIDWVTRVDVAYYWNTITIMVNQVELSQAGQFQLFQVTYDEYDDTKDVAKEYLEWLLWEWDQRSYWKRNYQVDFEWDEDAFVAYIREGLDG
jgi:hypothetical protein